MCHTLFLRSKAINPRITYFFQADKCLYFVNKLMMLSWNFKITRRLNIFVHQLSHCKVGFTACGLFEIDGTLVFTIIAAATMYLIVTYQFQQGLNKSCNSTLL
ncbi:putative gustatory receptor 28a [Coccinella septempunctata]|uniref:putative gustatory receptor 28a n=1 Tax=Coccinella septempunctata TaxID=41139 RepID=UPI001D06CD3B|nr:putative gustatory receptor 28a [Coccinella septempunctata]